MSQVTVRPVKETDARALLELYLALDEETSFMMLEPGERSRSVEAQQLRILQALSCPNGTILVADDGSRLVGLVEVCGCQYRRTRHVAHIAIGVLRSLWGQGVGRALLAEAEAWARGHGVHRLELTVMVHNERAVSVYRAAGFEVEGLRRHSILVDGVMVDELAMARLLG